MAAIILVHGIAQERYDAASLERKWLPALTTGLRRAGRRDLSEVVGFRGSHEIDIQMAFYGAAFLAPGSQGSSGVGQLSDKQLHLAESLARTWLAAAAQRAADPRDRSDAQKFLARIESPDHEAQTVRAGLRPAFEFLAGIRWFASAGLNVARRGLWPALTQVTRYLTEEEVRSYAQQKVVELVDQTTKVVVAHSLGTVVAYEALHHIRHPIALITLGSPLGMPTVIYPHLRPVPSRVPAAVAQWRNIFDPDDLIATTTDLQPLFPPADGQSVVPRSCPPVSNGIASHRDVNYLKQKATGEAIADGLTASQRTSR